MSKEYRIPKNIKTQDLVRGIINASYWHWHNIDEIQHTEAIKYLNNLEAVDQTNPSEALEKLNIIEENLTYELRKINKIGNQRLAIEIAVDLADKFEESIKPIKQALIKAQEQDKVLEILKEKKVEVGTLITLIKVHPNRALELYNESLGDNVRKWLKQEEFELLKRYFE